MLGMPPVGSWSGSTALPGAFMCVVSLEVHDTPVGQADAVLQGARAPRPQVNCPGRSEAPLRQASPTSGASHMSLAPHKAEVYSAVTCGMSYPLTRYLSGVQSFLLKKSGLKGSALSQNDGSH